MIDLRVRSQITDAEMQEKVGKIVTDADYNVLLTGPCRVQKPDGSLLMVYRPGVISSAAADAALPALRRLRGYVSDNRGDASGTQRVRREGDKRTRSQRVPSAIVGNFDPVGPKKYCRESSWTIRYPDEWRSMWPLLKEMGAVFHQEVPQRWRAQMEYVERTQPEWVIPETPYTTITVNNTYPTGVHTDKGDLDGGFSNMICLRSGSYTGGVLVIPRYRIAVDMHDRDMILFDAHEFHGNTMIEAEREPQPNPRQPTRYKDAERITVVAYYRTCMATCGSTEQELARAAEYHEAGGVLR